MGEAKRRRAAADTVLPNGVRLTVNRPTQQGYELGAHLAKMADEGEPALRLQFPAHAPRCKSCAFTTGTIPNGCEETVLDAMGALIEDVPFMCHQRFDDDGHPVELCAGWAFAKESPRLPLLRKISEGKPTYMPAREPAAQAYLDEERRKIRAKRKGPIPEPAVLVTRNVEETPNG